MELYERATARGVGSSRVLNERERSSRQQQQAGEWAHSIFINE